MFMRICKNGEMKETLGKGSRGKGGQKRLIVSALALILGIEWHSGAGENQKKQPAHSLKAVAERGRVGMKGKKPEQVGEKKRSPKQREKKNAIKARATFLKER